jgi:hypothetical protein
LQDPEIISLQKRKGKERFIGWASSLSLDMARKPQEHIVTSGKMRKEGNCVKVSTGYQAYVLKQKGSRGIPKTPFENAVRCTEKKRRREVPYKKHMKRECFKLCA